MARTTANCPACDSPISRQRYDQILRIDEARQKQLAAERGALEREREALKKERASVAQAATAAERARWEATTAKAKVAAAQEVERVRKAGEAERQRLAQAHEKRLEAECRRHQAAEKKLARDRAALEARARVQVEQGVRAARREAEDGQRRAVEGLRTKLATEEQRRARDAAGWKRKIAELERKADASDVRHFGPESEEELEQVLKGEFRGDHVERRGKNGDVLHAVRDAGKDAALMVYERKKTKGWKASDLRQIKDAMEAHGTKYGVLVTRFFPRGRSGLTVVDGVILVEPEMAVAVAGIVREGIIGISRLGLSEHGKAQKAELLLEYVRADEFTTAIQLAQAKVAELRQSLEHERSYHDGWWRKREQIYSSILRATSGVAARVREVLGAETGGSNGGSSAHLNGKRV